MSTGRARDTGEAQTWPGGPVLIEHQRGHFHAEFQQSDYFDYIDLHIRMGGEARFVTPYLPETDQELTVARRTFRQPSLSCTLEMGSLFGGFTDLIHFLEAIIVGVQECAFAWNTEGPSGSMRWHGSGNSGSIEIAWSSRPEPFRFTTSVARGVLVGRMYSAFRKFVASDGYNPLRYESLSDLQALEAILQGSTTDQLIATIAAMSRQEAQAALEGTSRAISRAADQMGRQRVRLQEILELSAPSGLDLLDVSWELADIGARTKKLRELISSSNTCCWTGCNLRALRSPLIESWLYLGGGPSLSNEGS